LDNNGKLLNNNEILNRNYQNIKQFHARKTTLSSTLLIRTRFQVGSPSNKQI